MQYTIAQSVAIEALDGHQTLVVVGHGDKAKPFAFVSLQVTDHLDILHGSKGAKQLPKNIFFRFRRQVVDENTPTTAINGRRITGGRGGRRAWNYGATSQQFSGQWRIPVKINTYYDLINGLRI